MKVTTGWTLGWGKGRATSRRRFFCSIQRFGQPEQPDKIGIVRTKAAAQQLLAEVQNLVNGPDDVRNDLVIIRLWRKVRGT